MLLPLWGNAQQNKVVSINVNGVNAEILQFGSLTGSIVATYEDGTTETVDVSNTTYLIPIYVGSKNIEITYKGAKATKKVNVVADKDFDSFELYNLPSELPAGADLSTYKVTVYIYYKEKSYTSFYCPLSEFKINGFDVNKIGRHNALIVLNGEYQPFGVEVFRVPESLDLSNLPSSVEQFSALPSNIKVIAKYSDGTTEEITLKYYSLSFSSSEVGTATAKVTYNNAEATKTITVTECPGKPNIKDDFYQIANADNLYWFAKYSSGHYGLKAELTADIVVNENVLTDDGKLDEKRAGSFKQWIPIHLDDGEFKGNGHVIKGLYLVNNTASFFNAYSAKISGLGLEDFYFENPDGQASAFSYYVSELTNCYAIGYLKGKEVYGLCYGSSYNGIIKDCYSYCTLDVKHSGTVGAITSRYNYAGFTNCLANADLVPSGVEIQESDYIMSMDKLCNGTLPEGFSTEVWSSGSKSGSTYTFPHLKAFSSSAYSVTLGNYAVTAPSRTQYFVDENIDLTNAKYGKMFRGGVLDQEAITESDVTGFSTAKAGTFTATITHKGVSTKYKYTVVKASKIFSMPPKCAQNSALEDIGITLIYNDWYYVNTNFARAKVTGLDVTKLGNQEITVKIGGFTQTYTIEVCKPLEPTKTAKSIDLSGIGNEVEQYYGHLSGTFKVTYEDGSVEIVDASNYARTYPTLGEQTLSFVYNGASAERTITVVKNTHEPKTIDGVYQISTVDDLFLYLSMLSGYSHTNPASAVLTNDIVINTNLLNADGTPNRQATMYNTYSLPQSPRLYGTFDGQGHTISGIYRFSQEGLFRDNYGTIKNLGITDSYFFGIGNSYLGSFCSINSGNIINCWSDATIESYYSLGASIAPNSGGICWSNYGIIANCHYVGMPIFYLSDEYGEMCANNYSNGVILNSYYLTDKGDANEYAKTSDEFADGTILNLLKNGVTGIADGDIWVQNIGLDKFPSFTEGKAEEQTPVTTIAKKSDINVWSYNRTLYIENAPADTKYEIVDLSGRIITTSKTKSTKEEIKINQTGVLIVKIGNNTFKVLL